MTEWHGVVVAESLGDPTLLNACPVYRTYISGPQPLDPTGTLGNWHLYWVRVPSTTIDAIRAALVDGWWYAHFWNADRLRVVFADAEFEVARDDPSTWQPAVEHGLAKGIPREWLDFPTDDSTGTLE